MFTFGAFIFLALLAWLASRANEKDRRSYDTTAYDQREWLLLLHIRQNMKVVAFLLAGVIVMLGVIADRLH